MPSLFVNHKPFCTAVFSKMAFLGLVELVTTASCVVMYSLHACTRVVLQLTFPVYVCTHTRVICFEFHCVACSFTYPAHTYYIVLICSYCRSVMYYVVGITEVKSHTYSMLLISLVMCTCVYVRT